ncbi:MAG: zinc ribbon domain-containing protein [Dehalococcoidia bacterium]|nr:zinc ribbon domain-containing protein [Dehalococcoidia bacterium]
MAPSFCSKCGTALDGQRFCPKCGTAAPGAGPDHCQSCGTELQPGARFCPTCGATVGQPAAPGPAVRPAAPPRPAYRPPAPKRKGMGMFGWIIALVGICGLLAICAASIYTLRDRIPGLSDTGTVSQAPPSPTPEIKPTLAEGEAWVAGVLMRLPSGWTTREVSSNELIMALSSADLSAELPQGPRVRVERVAPVAIDTQALLSGSANVTVVSIVQPSAAFNAADAEGVGIALQERQNNVVYGREYIFFNMGKGRQIRFTLEGPDKAFTDNRSAMEGVVKGAKFNASR